jgi:inner membrane protein
MDSLTQIVLGAAIGELIAGRKLGNKAALMGALAGTIPDLDVLFALFTDPVTYLSIHRGFSHSLFFPFLAAPVLGWATHKMWPNAGGNLQLWVKLYFWVILTHPLLDLLTGYGTQLLNPLSTYAFELNTIFIIDPLYTLPLATILLISLRLPRESRIRRRMGLAAIIVSTSWLFITASLKLAAIPVFKAELDRQEITYHRMMTIPGPFSSFLWRALVETDQGYFQGYYSIFDARDKPISFHFTPRNEHYLIEVIESEAVKRLLWFSKGYYTVSKENNTIVFNDLRFGSYNSWSGNWDSFIFSFLVRELPNGDFTFEQVQNPVQFQKSDFSSLMSKTFNRIPR